MTERTFTAEERSRAACQTLIEAIGSIGPENVEDAAKRAVTALAAAHERETALREELDGIESALGLPPAMRPHSISALKIINAKNQAMDTAETTLAEAQREIERLSERYGRQAETIGKYQDELRAERQKVQELEQLVAELQKHAREDGWQDVDEPIAALLAYRLTDADRAVGKRG